MGEADPAGPKLLGQALKEMKVVTESQIQEALSLQRRKGGLLGEILVSLGHVAREEIQLGLAAQMGMEVVDLEEFDLDGGLPPQSP